MATIMANAGQGTALPCCHSSCASGSSFLLALLALALLAAALRSLADLVPTPHCLDLRGSKLSADVIARLGLLGRNGLLRLELALFLECNLGIVCVFLLL